MAKDIAGFLEQLGLSRFGEVFAENEVDLDILPRLSDDDLKDLGLPLGARRRLQRALESLAENGLDAAVEPDDPAAADEAERRQLTVMFCDLVGSTALSTRVDPEDLRGVLTRFHDRTTEEIERYGGYVAKYMGDGVLAYFGYPEAHEDDAERAINAGLDIVAAVTGGCANTSEVGDTSVRIGIATGFVVVGDLIGHDTAQERAVVGETPNLAARLQGLAEPDSVIIDAATEELAGGLFELEDHGAHPLKGFADPQRAWAVTGRRRTESRFAAVRRPTLTQLIGRDEELELLLRRWQRASTGEGQLVLIHGEPGIGKSRLVHAALEHIANEPHTRVRYQCSPFHTNTALHPAIEQLEIAAGFDPSDSNDARLDKLETVIEMAGRPVESDIPLLAGLLSIDSADRHVAPSVSPERRKQLLIETLVAHLDGLSRQQPVVFVVEDTHWIDPTTLELLDLAVERLLAIPVLMIVTHRPSFVATWVGRSQVTVLTLNRLDRRESATLAQVVSRGLSLPQSLLEQIVAKTDGIPLFLEEFTRATVDAGASDKTIAVPATLKDALEARLDQLDVGREVAQIGAAIGRSFDYRVLRDVCGQDDVQLRHALDELVDAQLLFVRGEPPVANYTFKHALVQDTAHDSMLRARRASVHARIADALAAQDPSIADEEPEILAHHLTEADRIEEAVPYWRRAGEVAAQGSATQEAIHHFLRAIELVGSLPESMETKAQELATQVLLAPSYMAHKHFGSPDAERAYRRALELARELGDSARTFSAQWGLWMATSQRDACLALTNVEELLDLSDASGDEDQRLQACHTSWTTNFLVGNVEAARVHAEEGIRIYDAERHASHKFRYGGHDPGVCCRTFLSGAQFLDGRADTSLTTLADATSLAESIGHPISRIIAWNFQSLLGVFRREPERVHDGVERSTAIAEEFGIASAMWSSAYRGWVLGHRGQPDEGLDLFESHFEETGTAGQEGMRTFLVVLLVELCQMAGHYEKGIEEVSKGLELDDQRTTHLSRAELYRLRGELYLRADRPPEAAEACFRDALDLAARQGTKSWSLRAATSLARLWASSGQTAQARELLTPIYDSFTEGLDLADLKDAKTLLDELD